MSEIASGTPSNSALAVAFSGRHVALSQRLLSFFVVSVCATEVLGGPAEERLIDEIFKVRRYQKLARPVRRESEAVDVVFGLSLQQIIAVVSRSLSLSLSLSLFTSPPVQKRTVVMGMPVCLSVCPSASLSHVSK